MLSSVQLIYLISGHLGSVPVSGQYSTRLGRWYASKTLYRVAEVDIIRVTSCEVVITVCRRKGLINSTKKLE